MVMAMAMGTMATAMVTMVLRRKLIRERIPMERRNASESTGGRQSHSHHRRRKKPLYRRIRHWILKHKRQIAATVAVCVVAAGGVGLLIRHQLQKQESMQITAGNSHDVGNSYRELTYKGKKYCYNSLVRTILYAGIDEEWMFSQRVSNMAIRAGQTA